MDTKKLILFTDLNKKVPTQKQATIKVPFTELNYNQKQQNGKIWETMTAAIFVHSVNCILVCVSLYKVSWEALHIVFTRISIIETDIVIWEGAVS